MGKEIKYNLRGGLVTAPVLYLKNVKNIDEEYLVKEKECVVDSVGSALCEHFDNHSNCTLTGVYNMNKGYADFTVITILYQNDEYSIIKSNTRYGLAEYDFIVLDAASVKPDQILNE